MIYDQTIRTKKSILSSRRYYNKALLSFTSFVEAFTSILQFYAFLFKLIQILLCKSKFNTFTLLHLEIIYTTYSFLYFILGSQYLFMASGVTLLILIFNYRGPSWLDIKIVILLYKVHSKPVKNAKKCLSKSLFKSTQTFSDYKPGANLNKNRYLPGLLMSYSRLFHANA